MSNATSKMRTKSRMASTLVVMLYALHMADPTRHRVPPQRSSSKPQRRARWLHTVDQEWEIPCNTLSPALRRPRARLHAPAATRRVLAVGWLG